MPPIRIHPLSSRCRFNDIATTSPRRRARTFFRRCRFVVFSQYRLIEVIVLILRPTACVCSGSLPRVSLAFVSGEEETLADTVSKETLADKVSSSCNRQGAGLQLNANVATCQLDACSSLLAPWYYYIFKVRIFSFLVGQHL